MGLYGGIYYLNSQKKVSQKELNIMATQFPRKPAAINYFLQDNIGLFDISDNSETKSEIYNDPKTLTVSNADLYEEVKDPEKNRINGVYTIFILSKKSGEVKIRTDRFGKKILYYYLSNNALYFCSFLNGLLVIPELKKELNKEALNSYLYSGLNVGEETFFKGIKKLNKGKTLTLKNGRIFVTREIFRLHPLKLPMRFEQRKNLLKNKLTEAIQNLCIKDVGIWISGGIDSCVILAAASDKISCSHSKAFSFEAPPYAEKEYIKAILSRYPLRHETCKISAPEFVSYSDTYIKDLCEPPPGPTTLGNFIFADKIRNKVSLVLSGVGADELLGGYPKIFNHYKDFGLEESPFNKASHFAKLWTLPVKAVALVIADKQIQDYGRLPITKYFKGLFQSTKSAPYKEQIFDVMQAFYLTEDLPLKIRGLQPRYPFFDINIFELLNSLPYDDKIHNQGQSPENFKYILRKAFESELPKEILQRGKIGFTIPILNWGDSFILEMKHILGQKLKLEIFNDHAIGEIFRWSLETKRTEFFELLWRIYNLKIWLSEYFGA